MRERIPTWLKTIVEIEKGATCGICDQPIKFGEPYEIDHMYPISRGGSNSLGNLQVVHKNCNRKKGASKSMVTSDQWVVWGNLIKPNLDKLRDNQKEAYINTIERITNFDKYPDKDYRICPGGKPKIYCECTGAGKSILMIILGILLARKRILIVTPSKVIKIANFDALQDAFELGVIPKTVIDEINITTLDQPSLAYIHTADIVIATYQKLGKKDADRILANLRGDEFDVVLIDEAHHYKEFETDTTHQDIVKKFKNSIILFFTATPFDAKLNPILSEFDRERDVIHEFKYADAWKKNYVKYFEWTEIKPEQQTLLITHPNGRTEKLDLKSGDLDEAKKLYGYKSALSKSDPAKLSLIYATIQLLTQRNEDLRGIAKKNIALMVFTNIKEAEECSKILNRINTHYRHCVVHSGNADDKLLSEIKNNVYDILLSVSMFKEGFNQKNITIVTLCRPIQSYVFFTQVVGRGVRARKDIYGNPIPVSGHARNMKDICYIVTHDGFGLQKYWELFRELDLEDLTDVQEQTEKNIDAEFINEKQTTNDIITVPPLVAITDEKVKGYDSDGFDDGRTYRDETIAHYFKLAVEKSDNIDFKLAFEKAWKVDAGRYVSKMFQQTRSREFVDMRNLSSSPPIVDEKDSKKDLQRETIDTAKTLQNILRRQLMKCIRKGAKIDFQRIMQIMYRTFKQIYGHPLKGGATTAGYRLNPSDINFVKNEVPKLIERYQSTTYFKQNFLPKFKENLEKSDRVPFID